MKLIYSITFIANTLLFKCCAAATCINGTKTLVPSNCDEYYLCENGELVKKPCPLLKFFDSNSSECKLFYNVSCNGPKLATVFRHTTLPAGTPEVHECTNGTKQAMEGGSMKLYKECVNGQHEMKQCDYLQIFDPTILTCRHFTSIKVNSTSLPVTTKVHSNYENNFHTLPSSSSRYNVITPNPVSTVTWMHLTPTISTAVPSTTTTRTTTTRTTTTPHPYVVQIYINKLIISNNTFNILDKLKQLSTIFDKLTSQETENGL